MVNTREKIMQVALDMFNSQGLENVSTYDIAKQINIRQSNITYYFPAKNNLVNALAKQMVAEVDAVMLDNGSTAETFSFKTFYTLVDSVMRVHQKYKFLLLNYAPIITADAELNQYFVDVLAGRPNDFRGILSLLLGNGYIGDAEPLLAYGNAVSLLLNMTGIYWIQEAAIYMANRSPDEQRQHHLKLFFQPFVPYLTIKGKRQLNALIGNA